MRAESTRMPWLARAALSLGYRHLDTAERYGNEDAVGAGLAASGLKRGDVFLTTKIWFDRPDGASIRRAFDDSLKRLATPYVDLLLIHWPSPRLQLADALKSLAEIRAEGRAISIGVSNFQPAHLDRIVAETGVVPAVNQIEVHPYFTNEAAREASHRHGALVEAWAPIAQGAVVDDEVIGKAPYSFWKIFFFVLFLVAVVAVIAVVAGGGKAKSSSSSGERAPATLPAKAPSRR